MTGPAVVTTDFRYSRQINRGRGGLQTLALDAAVLAHSRNLIDIRIVDDKGRQVPYLVEKRDEPLEVPLRVVPAAGAAPQTSRYSIALPYPGLPDSRLVLETNSRVFDRTVDVSNPSADERDRRDSLETSVASTEWKHSDPEIRTLPLTIDLPPQRGNALTLTVHEGDNPPLPIQSVRLLLPSYRLRFFAADRSTLRLIYRNPTIAAPQYDLALVAPRVLDATRCISYLTIESRSDIPADLRESVGALIYGCDICQDVCPWNVTFSRDSREPAFQERDAIAGKDARTLAHEILAMNDEQFRAVFKGSAMKRAKLSGLKRNAVVVLENVTGLP